MKRHIVKSIEKEEVIAVRSAICSRNGKVQIIKYNDSSVWIACPDFGWFESGFQKRLGCKERRRRCTWFFG